MLIDADGAIEGSITGGCVESDVVVERAGDPRGRRRAAAAALRRLRRARQHRRADVRRERRGASCTSCAARRARSAREAFEAAATRCDRAIATLVDGPGAGAKLAVIGDEVLGGFGGPELLDHTVARDLRALSERRTSALRHYGGGGEALGSELTVHLHAFGVPPTLVLVGAIDYSAAVAALAGAGRLPRRDRRRARGVRALGPLLARRRRSTSAGPRRRSTTRALGPRDAVIVFSHDPKFDEPAILAALRQRRRLHRRARQPPHRARTATARLAAAGVERGRAGPRALAVRAGHRRRDARGGRDLDHGRGDRGALGPRRRAADQRAGLDPPALRALTGATSPRGRGAPTACRCRRRRRGRRTRTRRTRSVSSSPRAPSSPRSSPTAGEQARSSSTGWPGRPA